MNRREREKAKKKARILSAARRLFAQGGYEATTMRALAEEADVGVGTLYQYARDKVALAEMISAEDLGQAVHQALETLPPVGVRGQMMHLFVAFYAVHRRDPDLARTMIRELSVARDGDTDARTSRFAAVLNLLAGFVERGQERSEIMKGIDPLELATAAFGQHYFILVAWLAGGGLIESPEQSLDRQLALLFRGLERRGDP